MRLDWLIGEAGPRDDERHGWVEDGFVALITAAALGLIVLAWGCASVPVPPPVGSQPVRPSPMCKVGVDFYDCWVEPSAGRFEYVCAVRNGLGAITGTQNVAQPALCPQTVTPLPVTPCASEADLVTSEAQGVSIYSAAVFDAMNRTQASPIAAESRRRLAEALKPVLGPGVCVIVGQEALFLSRP